MDASEISTPTSISGPISPASDVASSPGSGGGARDWLFFIGKHQEPGVALPPEL